MLEDYKIYFDPASEVETDKKVNSIDEIKDDGKIIFTDLDPEFKEIADKHFKDLLW